MPSAPSSSFSPSSASSGNNNNDTPGAEQQYRQQVEDKAPGTTIPPAGTIDSEDESTPPLTPSPQRQPTLPPASGSSSNSSSSSEDKDGPATTPDTAKAIPKATTPSLAPTLTRPGYFTSSPLKVLQSMTEGELWRVRRFTVMNEQFGQIVWDGETDVRGLELDKLVEIHHGTASVFPDGQKHPMGQGLKKPAMVTLWKLTAPGMAQGEVEGIVRGYLRLVKGEFMSWNPHSGRCQFRVPHFSTYTLPPLLKAKATTAIATGPREHSKASGPKGGNSKDDKEATGGGPAAERGEDIHQQHPPAPRVIKISYKDDSGHLEIEVVY